jgi:signal transduction histidine kinase/CheY-like chemotaxis protein
MYNKIQVKIIALILLLTAIFMFGLFSLRNSENKNFAKMLNGRIAERDTIIRKIIDLKSKSLINYVYDYSYWDEMVSFSQSLDEKWALENIVTSIPTFDVDAVWLFDKELNLIYSTNKSNDRTLKLPLSKEDLKSIINTNLFSHFYINTSRGLMEISVAPLQPSSDMQRVSVPLGYFIGGRFWTEEYVGSLSQLTNSKINIISNSKYSDTIPQLKLYEFANEFLLKEWSGSTLSKIRAVSTSESTKEFLNYSKYQFIATIIFVILVILMILLYLLRLLNRPLKAITESLERESPEPIKKLQSKKNEFGEMARLISEFFKNKESLLEEIDMRIKAEAKLINKQEELIKSKQKAEELSKIKSNLLANLSHEFRTPLSGIIGISELLKNEVHDNEQLKLLDDITISGKRLHDTLNSILMLAQFESTDISLHKEKFNLSNEISDYFKKHSYKAEEKNLDLKILIEEDDIYAETDKDLLKNVLYNIFDNAVKFTDKGSIKIILSTKKINDIINAEIAIIDTGIGISQNNIGIIFEEFRQASEGFTRNYEGSGLGLTLSKKIIKFLGGDIVCTSEPGIGSTFTVNIPAFKIINVYTEPEKEIQAKKEDFLNILFVEDNLSNQYVFKKFIENTVNVDFASTGENAIEFINIKKYDLIFLDINLGTGIDGIEVLKRIRKIESYKNTPVAALTGYAMEHDRDHFLSNGFDYFVIKPFGRSDLMNVINEIKKRINSDR